MDDEVERYRLRAVAWAEKDGEARIADRLRKSVFSEIVNQGEGAVSAREHAATCHSRYTSAVNNAEKLRTEANVCKAHCDADMIKFEAWRTRNANRRAEMKIL